jgi:DNA-binding CsgD family transcriptional regulator
VIVLKNKHPEISPSELKLCAYLRMNLSSKEIAQLLNISVRGVEISRYRLRKKLNLATGENLFDYLIQLQKEQ